MQDNDEDPTVCFSLPWTISQVCQRFSHFLDLVKSACYTTISQQAYAFKVAKYTISIWLHGFYPFKFSVCVCLPYLVTFQTAIDRPSTAAITRFTRTLGPQRCANFSVEQTPALLTVSSFQSERVCRGEGVSTACGKDKDGINHAAPQF